ncbi:hypothetical protein Y032_0046g1365 [Ancylostoma ceylanicum]|uniref:Uncharacterized protein n=1 Tax=Ancylostoma ceylanicum TaxID=53326 RepID=A0A016UCM2_9BILA|nr:hypothetical protein Y032_0046g1365 [Ancylostoma ceylanicum]
MLATGDRQCWRRAIANVGDRPPPMLATVATAPIDCGISQSVADVGDSDRRPPSPATANRGAILLEEYSGYLINYKSYLQAAFG